MTLFTVGHGTVDASELLARLAAAGITAVVDVRRYPGSRRMPWFAAAAMTEWLPAAGVAYVPAQELGGRRRPEPGSPNIALRNPAFRAYADYMTTPPFRAAFSALIERAAAEPVAILCSETLWWRCHRRLIADAAVLLAGTSVVHLVGATRAPHALTEGVRVAGDALVYDAGSLGVEVPQ